MSWLPTFIIRIWLRAMHCAAPRLAVLVILVFTPLSSAGQGLPEPLWGKSFPSLKPLTNDLSLDFLGNGPLLQDNWTLVPFLATRDVPEFGLLPREKATKESLLALGTQPVPPDRTSLTSTLLLTRESGTFINGTAFDFVLPVPVGSDWTLYFEGRSEFENLLARNAFDPNSRIDTSLGTGFRVQPRPGHWIGANCFWDASRLGGAWYSAFGIGFETDFEISKNRGIDISFSRYQGGGLDMELGLNLSLAEESANVRLMVGKYRFFDGDYVLGWRAGIDVANSDRTLGVIYEFSQDSRTPQRHTVGIYASLALRLEDVFKGRNPFSSSPSGTRFVRTAESRRGDSAQRMWRLPRTVVAARNTPQGKWWSGPGKVKYEADYVPNLISRVGLNRPIQLFGKVDDSDEQYDWTEKCEWAEKYNMPEACLRVTHRDSSAKGKKPVSLSSWLGRLIAAGVYSGFDYSYRFLFGPYETDPKGLELETETREYWEKLKK